jgi:UDP-N-acetylglucosamine 2-epimerase (non-hydrolysing)
MALLNKKRRILLAYGTRPELIKLAPVIFELKKRKNIRLLIVNTGQHKEMLDELEKFFFLKPDINFNIMTPNQSLNGILGAIHGKASSLFNSFKPELVIVQGDTTTVLAIGITAFYSNIQVAHIEAGLRSFDIHNPYPEEFNRRVISLFAGYNFVPTKLSAKNLLVENIPASTIFITGNTGVDALLLVLKKQKRPAALQGPKKKILITAHRRENHGKGILAICEAVRRILALRDDIEFIWPVHPNPNVQKVAYARLRDLSGVMLCAPLSYLELVRTMNESWLIWTDSGGIQEEAPTLKKPVLILRKVTERPEVLTSGFGILVGTNTDKIVNNTISLLNNKRKYKRMVSGKNPFGDGDAAKKIVRILV